MRQNENLQQQQATTHLALFSIKKEEKTLKKCF
jgi:hypothetical protein